MLDSKKDRQFIIKSTSKNSKESTIKDINASGIFSNKYSIVLKAKIIENIPNKKGKGNVNVNVNVNSFAERKSPKEPSVKPSPPLKRPTITTEDLSKNVSQNIFRPRKESGGSSMVNSYIRKSPEVTKALSQNAIESSELYQELKSAYDREYDNNLKLTAKLREREEEIKQLKEILNSQKARPADDEKLLKRKDEEILLIKTENKKLKEDKLKLFNRIKTLEEAEEERKNNEDVNELHRHIREVNELKSTLIARILQLESLPLFFMGGGEEERRSSTNEFDLANPNSINPDNMSYEQLLRLQDQVGYVNRGFKPEEIKLIPKYKVRTAVEKGNSCSICVSTFTDNEKCRKLGCSHYYHAKCIKQWLLREKNCPICKTEVQIT